MLHISKNNGGGVQKLGEKHNIDIIIACVCISVLLELR